MPARAELQQRNRKIKKLRNKWTNEETEENMLFLVECLLVLWGWETETLTFRAGISTLSPRLTEPERTVPVITVP